MEENEYVNEVEKPAPEKKSSALSRGSLVLMILAIVLILLGAILGLTLHYTLPRDPEVPEVPRGARQQAVAACIPEGEDPDNPDNDKRLCEERGCLWTLPTDGAPGCVFGDGYGYSYSSEEVTTLGLKVKLTRIPNPTLFDDDVDKVDLHIDFYDNHMLRLKFTDEADDARYQVPKEAVDVPVPASPPANLTRLYDVELVKEPHFGVKVIRRSTGAVVFDTTVPGMTFSDQYLQVTTRLPSGNLYGFGEHNHRRFRHDLAWKRWAIFTRDVAPVDEWNLYGAQPMYMNLEADGSANAVLLLNSNAMDVVLQPDPYPAISFRVIGGILDFYLFLGPSPENVVQQYTKAVGRSLMPPYWSLGFQLSRWDYDNLTHVQTVVNRNRDAGIPQDVQYGDIDYMESKLDFTVDLVKYQGLSQFVDELHSRGQKYIIILDHGIGTNQTVFNLKLNGSYPAYTTGLEAGHDVFVRDGRDTTKYLEGEVWPGLVYYPDFTKLDAATDWWYEHCNDFYRNKWRVEYDALWIDMNEPSNFLQGSTTGCEKNKFNYPPYVPNILGAGDDGKMYDKTICMDAVHDWGKHYDVHSLYGHSMSIVTFNTLRRKDPDLRPLVLTRSNFIGTQKYAQHWLGDNQSQWRQIPWSIVGMLEYSLFGFSYTGADICGFWYATTHEMCMRWMQLGAFYPFARNHNAATWPDQDPAAFGPDMIRVSRDILLTRYKLLPFLYTLMHKAHVNGDTVVRPLLHEFPTDSNTWSVDRQFLWGPSFLITPVMEEGKTVVEGYFPKARWYDYYGGKEMEWTGSKKNLTTPVDKINLHVRGGYIIPWQEPANTTVFSRRNAMGLTVALGEAPSLEARGSLFWDDGVSFETFEKGQYLSLEFYTSNYKLDITVAQNYTAAFTELNFDTVEIWGMGRPPAWVKVNGVDLAADRVMYDPYTKAITLNQLQLMITEEHTVEWGTSV